MISVGWVKLLLIVFHETPKYKALTMHMPGGFMTLKMKLKIVMLILVVLSVLELISVFLLL